MKTRNLLFLAFTIATLSLANAQKIKLKKQIVYVDGKETFAFKRENMATQFTLFTLDEENEIFFLNRDTDGDFIQITFLKANRRLENSSSLVFPAKYIIKKLLENKVLNLDGNINPDKLDIFFTKYDENITERTVRY